ncbi:ADP-ribosylation factor, Arf Arf6 [Sarracenia purpurea var. burkii]
MRLKSIVVRSKTGLHGGWSSSSSGCSGGDFWDHIQTWMRFVGAKTEGSMVFLGRKEVQEAFLQLFEGPLLRLQFGIEVIVECVEMRLSSVGFNQPLPEGEKRCLNSELWHACAGPLVSLPAVGSRVVYFPQGHSEQVAASTNKEVDAHIPNYPSLPPQLICQLHNVTMHADVDTDDVYAQMTLQPLSPVS